MGGAVEMTAGHLVHGFEDRVQRHVEFLAVHAVGDEDLDLDLSVGRAELDVAAVGDAALCRQFVRDLYEGSRSHALDAGGAIGHASLLEVFEEAAVVEVEIEFGGGLFGRFDPLGWIEPRLAVIEGKLFSEEDGRVGSIFRDGPLQGAVAFEALVADASHERGEAGDLVHDLGGMGVAPVGAEALGDELNDLPIGFGFAEGLERLVDALDSALGAGEGAFFFERGRGGQDDVRVLRGNGEVDVLNDEEVDHTQGTLHRWHWHRR